MGVYLLADSSWWLDLGNLGALLRALLGLGLVIFVHELGHFLVAKACGVKCEKFYVGFDPPFKHFPRTLWKKQWGETEYGIGIIPLGGYVKMLGQDDNPANAAREAERIRIASEAEKAADATGDLDIEPTSSGPSGFKLDPRSYPAKSVPQRMAIISAGVIMNLIFAVIFAAIAYQMGVSYIPCNIGQTVPGDPAWQAGVQPGDKIVRLGDQESVDDHLRFLHDLKFAVAAAGNGGQLDIAIRRQDGSTRDLTLQPSATLKEEIGGPSIGVMTAHSNIVEKDDYVAHRTATILGREPSSTNDDANRLQYHDEVVGIRAGSDTYAIDRDSAFRIDGIVARHRADPLIFDVIRHDEGTGKDGNRAPTDEPFKTTVSLSPVEMRGLGLSMVPGPVVAIQSGSPSEAAGLKVGDVIIAVAGQDVIEPMMIDQYLIDHIGKPTELTVQRDGTNVSIMITPRPPMGAGESSYADGPISAECLGAAIRITNQVGHVAPDANLPIQPGDLVEKASFVAKKESKLTARQRLALGISRPFTFGQEGGYSWADLINRVQYLPADLEIRLTVSHGKKQEIVPLKPVTVQGWYRPERDIAFQGVTDVRVVSSIGDAVQLGVAETWNGIEQVLYTLKNIGRHFKQLGGPLTIGVVAASEASQGLPRLLIFLTLLSANLAVINFLPIPVLDGGHMMFLIAEGIRGKPVNERWAFYLTMIGFSFILALMVFVIGLDVNRFFPVVTG